MRLKKWFLILICTLSTYGYCTTLGVGPSIEPEILKRELKPIADGLVQASMSTQLIFSQSAKEFIQNAKSRIDMTYVGSAYGSLFVQEFDFIPLLVSNQKLQLVLLSNQAMSTEAVKASEHLTILVNRNDLLMMSHTQELLGEDIQYRYYSANAHILFQVLQNKQRLGAVSYEEMTLLPARLMRKMHIVLKQATSPIYFMIHPRLADQQKKLADIMMQFHNSWPSHKHKYPGVAYLNAYTFRRFTNEDYSELRNRRKLERLNKLLRKTAE